MLCEPHTGIDMYRVICLHIRRLVRIKGGGVPVSFVFALVEVEVRACQNTTHRVGGGREAAYGGVAGGSSSDSSTSRLRRVYISR